MVRKRVYKQNKLWKEVRTESIIGDISDRHIRDNLYSLVSAVIQSGMKDEGLTFFTYPSSKWWINISNLDYDYLFKEYKRKRSILLSAKSSKSKY
jgi:hypothetical protein